MSNLTVSGSDSPRIPQKNEKLFQQPLTQVEQKTNSCGAKALSLLHSLTLPIRLAARLIVYIARGVIHVTAQTIQMIIRCVKAIFNFPLQLIRAQLLEINARKQIRQNVSEIISDFKEGKAVFFDSKENIKPLKEIYQETFELTLRDCKEKSLDEINREFDKDIKRNFNFVIEDVRLSSEGTTQIEKVALPNLSDKLETEAAQLKRIEQANTILNSSMKNDEDKKWGKILKIICSQATLNSVLTMDSLLKLGTFHLDEDAVISCENGLVNLPGNHLVEHISIAKANYESSLPPVNIKVIREDGKIVRLDVSVYDKINVDVVKESGKKSHSETLTAVETKAHFSVSLNEGNNPVVSTYEIEYIQK